MVGVDCEWQEQSTAVFNYLKRFGYKPVRGLKGVGVGVYYLNEKSFIDFGQHDFSCTRLLTYKEFFDLMKANKITDNYPIY